MKKVKLILNYLGIFTLVLLIFITGFYFGRKQVLANQDLSYSQILDSEALQNTSDLTQKTNIITKEVEGVHWIKAGNEPYCPEDYPIKGKFDKNVNVFYTQDNKYYKRVVAHVCFATEDFASNKAGFIKKY